MVDREKVEIEILALLASSKTTEAAQLLFQNYQFPVRRYISAQGIPADSIEDLCGEVWLAATRSLKHFRGDAKLLTWLLEIARHKIADLRRVDPTRVTLPLEGFLLTLAASSSGRPSHRLEREQTRMTVQRLIRLLQPDEQELLELRYCHNLTPLEIAARRGRSERPNTISKRLSLLRSRLRGLMEGVSSNPGDDPCKSH